ncbi:MAG: ABC transporter substrate-binding protein [Pseudomonadaceae bacterium]|nr:ABC transporter substrate-binding protein [Pseudomonadaceae bacterium]
MYRQFSCLLAFCVTALCSFGVPAEPGVEPRQLQLGMVNAQSGPAAGLGRRVRDGAEAYFARVNAEVGVHGRRLHLLVRDDGYEPGRTAALTEEKIGSGQVFALFGYVSTPTSRAAMPAVLAAGVPYLFPFTGAEVLREPVHRWVFNVRASYFAETERLVRHMTEVLGVSRVGLIMQDDSFGETVKGGLAGALYKRDLTIVGEARIRRNSLEVGPAVECLKALQTQAILFVGTYRQLAVAVREARRQGIRAPFYSVSFVGTEDFIAEAGADGDGVYISQVVPAPDDERLPLVRAYRADMAGRELGHASLEGYIAAAVLAEALRRVGPEPTRARLVEVLESLDFDLGGFRVAFSPRNHQGSSAVYLTRVEQGRAVPVD